MKTDRLATYGKAQTPLWRTAQKEQVAEFF